MLDGAWIEILTELNKGPTRIGRGISSLELVQLQAPAPPLSSASPGSAPVKLLMLAIHNQIYIPVEENVFIIEVKGLFGSVQMWL
jgi:hypothetical protein